MPPTLPTSPAPRAHVEQASPGNLLRNPSGRQRLVPATPQVTGADLLNRLPVGVVAVGRDYGILAINEAARRLLSIPGVAVGEDFLHTMQEAPYAEVRQALDETFRSGETNQTGEFAVEEATTGEPSYLRLTCHPQPTGGETQRPENLLVVAEDVTAAVRARRLADKNYRLEKANRELGGLNEELRAAHEESLVNTEEAQAAAEEVETLNEELQATNEELETLNEELQATVEELNTTNDDLQARATELQELAQGQEEERAASEEARSRAENLVEQVRSERSRLEAILGNISDAVLAVDTEGNVLFSNQVFGETFGEHTVAEPGNLGSVEVLDEAGGVLAPEDGPSARAAGGELFVMQFGIRGRGWKPATLRG